jgi:hypothetical protein
MKHGSLRSFDRELLWSGLARGKLELVDVDSVPTAPHRRAASLASPLHSVGDGGPERALERLVVGDRPRVLGHHEVERFVDDELALVRAEAPSGCDFLR